MSSMSVRQKELTPEQLQRIADNKAIALARKRKLEGSVEALCEHKQKRENTEPTHQPQSATVARALDEEEDSEDWRFTQNWRFTHSASQRQVTH